jgi:starch-binding outer membrane protein, SusD/RagB family
MKTKLYLRGVAFAVFALISVSCKDQLQVGNPNSPTVAANVTDETGLTSFAQGVVYVNGFQIGYDSYFSVPYGYGESLGDAVGSDAVLSVIAIPAYVILDDGTKITNQSPPIGVLRSYTTRAATGAGNNATYEQWSQAYALNNGCNVLLSLIQGIPFNGDKASKQNTFKAWAYWWKGWAYAAIGTLYYSGLIVDQVDFSLGTLSSTNNHYVLHDQVMQASNKYYLKSDSVLSLITSSADYTEVMSDLIPTPCQVGHGNPPAVAEWHRNIQTMLARNILLNKLAPFVNNNPGAVIPKTSTSTMTNSDWTNVLNFTTAGVGPTDNVFSARSSSTNPIFNTAFGTVSALTTGPNSSTYFKISTRLIQCFNPADNRFTGNFSTDTVANFYSNLYFGTKYSLLDASVSPPPQGTYAYGNLSDGGYECFVGTSYEENALMLAEANIRLGNIDIGIGIINTVRAYQGAGIPALGTGLTQAQALAVLVKERRVALLFRGLSFYDMRRWGWTYDISNGGGSYGNRYYNVDGSVNINAIINYDFLDYWDVPADESQLNPAGQGSAATVNPNF